MKPSVRFHKPYWVLTYKAPHTICSLKFDTWGEAMRVAMRLQSGDLPEDWEGYGSPVMRPAPLTHTQRVAMLGLRRTIGCR